MNTYRQVPISGVAQRAGLLAMQSSQALERFRAALKTYDQAAGSARQARAIEAVIRTSPGIAENHTTIDEDDLTLLETIRDRYRVYARRNVALELTTYSDAHTMLKTLFF